MKITHLALIIISSSLASCVVPPSKAYDHNQKPNIAILDDYAVNIDLLKAEKFTVDSKKTWQNTGQFLENGDKVNITAHGSWSPAPALIAWSGPEGNMAWSVEVPGIPGSALMGKIGHAGKPFAVGTTRSFAVQDYGMLYLAMNDSFSYLFDNQGTVEAEIYRDGVSSSNAVKGSRLDVVSYTYDDASGNGSLSARITGDHFKTRQMMIAKIGEISSSKNVALKAGKESLKGGNYELRDESTRDNILTINFKALW